MPGRLATAATLWGLVASAGGCETCAGGANGAGFLPRWAPAKADGALGAEASAAGAMAGGGGAKSAAPVAAALLLGSLQAREEHREEYQLLFSLYS